IWAFFLRARSSDVYASFDVDVHLGFEVFDVAGRQMKLVFTIRIAVLAQASELGSQCMHRRFWALQFCCFYRVATPRAATGCVMLAHAVHGCALSLVAVAQAREASKDFVVYPEGD